MIPNQVFLTQKKKYSLIQSIPSKVVIGRGLLIPLLQKYSMFYYPPEVRRVEYWELGVFLLQYFPFVKM